MDETAVDLWRNERPPFDGLTLATALVEPPRARVASQAFVDVLLAHLPDAPQVQTAADWHEHDDDVTRGTPATWDDLAAALASDRSFELSCPVDDFVRRAWLAADGAFYLRWFRYDKTGSLAWKDEPAVCGSADVTAAPHVIAAASEAMAALQVRATVLPAREFFEARRAGRC